MYLIFMCLLTTVETQTTQAEGTFQLLEKAVLGFFGWTQNSCFFRATPRGD